MKDPTQRKPIWLDIETGGIDPSKSSILSIASGQGTDIRSVFAAPQAGTFLSSFSEEKILPQLRGKTLLSEKQSIESLIQQLEVNPRAPIAGFNIRGFDIGFIQRRARTYGLEKRFLQATKGREVLDPVYQVKDIVASAISRHADIGTFSTALEGKSWTAAEAAWDALPFEQRPTEYNLIAQVKGYLKADRESAMFKGWKLEDLYKLLPEEGKLAGQAHEAATDIKMTQRVTQAARTGELEQELQKPARAFQWMETVKARGYHQFGPGRLLSQADVKGLGLAIPRWFETRAAKFAGLGLAAVVAASLFSGKDDEYNTIEGLPHGGFAQSGRLQLTEFGSGWKGIAGDIRRAERLYKSTIRSLLTEQGINKKDISFISSIADDQITLTAMKGEEKLFFMRRSINDESIALDKIELSERLQGKGFGSQFYEYEERILKRLGLSGVETQSPTLNPLTARGQAIRYGSRPHPLFDMPGLKKHLGVADEEDFLSKLTSSKFTLAEWEQKSIVPTMMGTVGPIKPRPIPSRNSASNTMDGMGHSGIAHKLRKLLTPFGSKWDSMRNLVQGSETFAEMIASKGFQKALSKSKRVKELGAGAQGTAYLMKGQFRGQEFSFVRKIGQLHEQEADMARMFQDQFAPTVYRSKTKGFRSNRSVIDMEHFEGQTFDSISRSAQTAADLPGASDYQKLGEAVTAIHARGISHMDLHSGNVMRTKSGEVGIIDWGLAGKHGTDISDVLPSNKILRNVRGEEVTTRTAIHDVEMIQENMQEVRGSIDLDLNYTAPSSFKTPIQRRKVSQASLQRAASATSWSAGKSGSRRSKL